MGAYGEGNGLKLEMAPPPSLFPRGTLLFGQWWHGLLRRCAFQDSSLVRDAHRGSIPALWQVHWTWLRSDPHSGHRPAQSGRQRGFIGIATIADCRTASVRSRVWWSSIMKLGSVSSGKGKEAPVMMSIAGRYISSNWSCSVSEKPLRQRLHVQTALESSTPLTHMPSVTCMSCICPCTRLVPVSPRGANVASRVWC